MCLPCGLSLSGSTVCKLCLHVYILILMVTIGTPTLIVGNREMSLSLNLHIANLVLAEAHKTY